MAIKLNSKGCAGWDAVFERSRLEPAAINRNLCCECGT